MSRNNPNDKDEEEDITYYLKEMGWFALKVAAVAGGVILGTKAIVSTVGFRTAGIVAGSLASAYQSANAKAGNNIEKGSTFSQLQRMGASGMSNSTQATIVAATTAVVGIHALSKKTSKH